MQMNKKWAYICKVQVLMNLVKKMHEVTYIYINHLPYLLSVHTEHIYVGEHTVDAPERADERDCHLRRGRTKGRVAKSSIF